MPFLLLLLLALTCFPVAWPEPPDILGPDGSALATWAGVLLLALASAGLTWLGLRRMRLEPESQSLILRRLNQFRRYHAFLLMGFFVFALSLLGWGETVQASWPGEAQPFPGVQLLLLAPLVAGLLLSWVSAYPVERLSHDRLLLREPFPTRWAYLGLQARHNLLLVVPPLFLILLQQAVVFLWAGSEAFNALAPLLFTGLLAVGFASMPYIIRLFLGLRPLPPCPLRDRLEAVARRLRFRYSDILVWDTQQTIANAMVTGILPWMRYIVVTDRLIQELTYEEIEAVFGHEVGHVKHHHMLFYILVLLGSFMMLFTLFQLGADLLGSDMMKNVLGGLGEAVVQEAQASNAIIMVPLVALIAVYIVLVFGYISRRCERQADVFGARVTSCAHFIGALEKVAHLNGISRDKPGWLSSWQHGSIAQRIAFLEQLDSNRHVECAFQRRLGLLKWSMALGLLGFLSLSALFLGFERFWNILRDM